MKDVLIKMRRSWLAILILGWSVSAFAQTFQGSITGIITDPTGAVIAGARVTVTETDRGLSWSTTSHGDGTYTMALLPPGKYQLKVEKPGFKTILRGPINLTVNQHLEVDLRMRLGSEKTTIQVKGTSPILDTQTSSMGATLSEQQVDQLPLNGRQFLELALLAPGVTPGTPGSRISDRGGAIDVDGLRSSMNSYWLDGFDDTAIGVGQFTVAPPLDSVKEVRMETGVYDAKFGAHAGAQVNIITKSGTNAFHGSAYDYLQNTHLDARNFFDPVRPPAHRNQFGATLGGPIILPGVYNGVNRSFFFLAYEGTRDLRSFFNQARVPTLAERTGDFSDLLAPNCAVKTVLLNPLALMQGQIQPFTNINQVLPSPDPVGQAMVNLYPRPNLAGAICGAPNYVAQVNRKIYTDDYFGRVDHRWGVSNSAFFRYNLNRANQFFPPNTSPRAASTPLPGFGTFSHDEFQMAGVDWTHTFSPSLMNELKLGYNRWQIRDDNQDEGNPIAKQLGLQGLPTGSPLVTGYPTLNFAGYAGLGSNNTDPQGGAVNTFQLADTITEVHGNHTLAYGVDLRTVERGNFIVDTLVRGEFDFTGLVTGGLGQISPQVAQQLGCASPTCVLGNGVADALLGLPTDWLGGFQQYISGHLGEYDFFGQDTWRITSKLTLDLGLRYEYKGLSTDRQNHFANFDFNKGLLMVAGTKAVTLESFDPATGLFVPVGTESLGGPGENRSLQYPDKDDFAPRFGLAWQPFGSTRTVLRGGYGIYYSQPSGDVFFMKASNPPFVRLSAGNLQAALPLIQSGTLPIGSGALIQTALVGAVGPLFPTLSPFQLNFQDAMVQEWNLDVQRELGRSWLVDVGYVGTRGLRLPIETDPNQPINLSVNDSPAILAACETTGCPRPYPELSGFSYTQSAGSSIYHALQLKVSRHFARGLSLLGAYTYSQSLDTNSSAFTTSRDANFPQNSRDIAAEKGRSDFDIPQRLSIAYLYDLPVGAARWRLANARLNEVIENWELGGIFTAQSGPPFTPQISGNVSGADESAVTGSGNPTDRPNLTGQPFYPAHQSPNLWISPAAFSAPAPFTFGNAGRNILTGPGVESWDFSVIRRFRLGETRALEFRTEIFNLLNHPNFDIPERDLASPSFGQIFSTLPPLAGLASGGPGEPRQIQFALKLSW